MIKNLKDRERSACLECLSSMKYLPEFVWMMLMIESNNEYYQGVFYASHALETRCAEAVNVHTCHHSQTIAVALPLITALSSCSLCCDAYSVWWTSMKVSQPYHNHSG